MGLSVNPFGFTMKFPFRDVQNFKLACYQVRLASCLARPILFASLLLLKQVFFVRLDRNVS